MVTSYSDGARRRRGVRGALLRAIGVAVALAAVAACGSNKSKEEASAPAELVDFEQQYRVVALWSKGIGTGQGKEYNRLQPALDQDFIYAADVDGVVLALDRLTGKKVWKAKVGKQLTGAVGVGRDLVVLGNARGEVIALARDDGRELWRARVGGEVLAPPATDGNVVVAQTFDGKLYALDGATGAELWRVEHEAYSAAPRPVFRDGHFFFVTGFSAGAQMWSVKAGGKGVVTDTHVDWKIATPIPKYSSPIIVDDLLYVSMDDAFLACIEADTGTTVWKQRLRGRFRACPIYADGRLYFFSVEGVTTVIKPGRTFEVLATNALATDAPNNDPRRGPGFMASPAVVGKSLIVRTRHHLYRIEND